MVNIHIKEIDGLSAMMRSSLQGILKPRAIFAGSPAANPIAMGLKESLNFPPWPEE